MHAMHIIFRYRSECTYSHDAYPILGRMGSVEVRFNVGSGNNPDLKVELHSNYHDDAQCSNSAHAPETMSIENPAESESFTKVHDQNEGHYEGGNGGNMVSGDGHDIALIAGFCVTVFCFLVIGVCIGRSTQTNEYNKVFCDRASVWLYQLGFESYVDCHYSCMHYI